MRWIQRLHCMISSGVMLLAAPLLPQSLAQKAIDEAADRCQSKAPSTQDETQCMDAGFRAWDRELNRVYQALMQKLTMAEQEKLKASQLAWIKQRDLEFSLIQAVYARLDGTMYQPMHAASRMRVVRERTLILQRYLELLEAGPRK